MPVVLFRVDERLIHGQVVLGWGSQLRPERFAVVDDQLAASEWEQDLYRLAAGDAEVLFVTVDEARDRLEAWTSAPERTLVLTRDLPTMGRLATDGGLRDRTVNVGGIHHGPGRTEVLTYVHLSDEDRREVRALEEAGVSVSAQDLPDSQPVPLASLLDR